MPKELTPLETVSLFGTIRTAKDIDADYAIKYTTIMAWSKEDIDDPLHGYKRFLSELFKRLSTKRLAALQDESKDAEPGDFASLAKAIGMPLSDIESFSTSEIKWKKELVRFMLTIDKDLLSFLYDCIYTIVEHQDFTDADRAKTDTRVIKIQTGSENLAAKQKRKPASQRKPGETRGRKPKVRHIED